MTVAPFRIVSPVCGCAPIIAHVPHASTVVPDEVRDTILLDDAALHLELVRLTDWHADELFSWILDLGGSMFINTLSRMVLDPERFENDADEHMAAVGQGVVYTKTIDGEPLAAISAGVREARIAQYYRPYHAALTDLVASTLDRFGTALILDCHSFATVPLPSEPDQTPNRPDVCIGTDGVHTPLTLSDALEAAFRAEGLSVARDRPFAGTLVPLRFYESDSRVQSVMIEVRRGLYCDEATGERSAEFDVTRAAVQRATISALESTWRADRA